MIGSFNVVGAVAFFVGAALLTIVGIMVMDFLDNRNNKNNRGDE